MGLFERSNLLVPKSSRYAVFFYIAQCPSPLPHTTSKSRVQTLFQLPRWWYALWNRIFHRNDCLSRPQILSYSRETTPRRLLFITSSQMKSIATVSHTAALNSPHTSLPTTRLSAYGSAVNQWCQTGESNTRGLTWLSEWWVYVYLRPMMLKCKL